MVTAWVSATLLLSTPPNTPLSLLHGSGFTITTGRHMKRMPMTFLIFANQQSLRVINLPNTVSVYPYFYLQLKVKIILLSQVGPQRE